MFGADLQPLLDGSVSSSTLSQLGKTLQSATMQHRFFRSFPQWLGAFTKYAGAAIVCEQLTVARFLCYMNLLCKLHEEHEASSNAQSSTFLVILYDDLFRRSIARRVEQKDPDLNMNDAFQKVDKRLLGACQTRLDSVIASVGLGPTSYAAGPGRTPALESSLAKQTAAAEQAAKKAESAARTANQAANQQGLTAREEKRSSWYSENRGRSKFTKTGEKGGKGDGSSNGGKGKGSNKYY